METQKSTFQRNLIIILVVLYVISISAFLYTNWVLDPQNRQVWTILVNGLILSIPLVLLFGSIYVLVSAWREHAQGEQIDPKLAKIVRWAPRVASILIIFFISLFSLDVFGGPETLLEQLGGFLMHNIPSFILIALLAFAWKRPQVGFVAFLVFGILFGLRFANNIDSLGNLVLFVIPILLIASLFYIDWKWLTPQPPMESKPIA